MILIWLFELQVFWEVVQPLEALHSHLPHHQTLLACPPTSPGHKVQLCRHMVHRHVVNHLPTVRLVRASSHRLLVR